MLGIQLTNLHSNISTPAHYSTISHITPLAAPPATVISTLFAPTAFIEYKNLVLRTPGLATCSHMTTDSDVIIWIYNQHFTSW